MLVKTVQQAKRIIKIVFGFTLILAGVIMVFVPGPGLLTIALGLAVLAAEYVWARRLLDKMKARGVQLRDAVLARKVQNIEKSLDPQGRSEIDPTAPADKPTIQ